MENLQDSSGNFTRSYKISLKLRKTFRICGGNCVFPGFLGFSIVFVNLYLYFIYLYLLFYLYLFLLVFLCKFSYLPCFCWFYFLLNFYYFLLVLLVFPWLLKITNFSSLLFHYFFFRFSPQCFYSKQFLLITKV